MKLSVEYRDGYFLGVTSGEAEAERFAELLDAMLTHPDWKPGTSWIHDHTELEAGPLTVDDVQQIAQLCADRRTELGAGKSAIVVKRDLEFGLARMWAVYVDGKWDVVADVFRSRDDAIAWLTS